jgi:hypothetical protein
VPTNVGADIATLLSASIELPTKARNARAVLETEEFTVILLRLRTSAGRRRSEQNLDCPGVS